MAISINVILSGAVLLIIFLFSNENIVAKIVDAKPRIIPFVYSPEKRKIRYIAGITRIASINSYQINYFRNMIGSKTETKNEVVAKQVSATEILEALIDP